ncbi:MAG: hypothetical protein Q8L99_00765 [Polycyclovorans sp.]|jgi:hypothetical protein|nr:hypothetical protein [Polycyclovorans sp.]|tara:strand:- start:5364 stop:5579 length:216 start_codon:yes stop_codon:yes gene_type:complete
METTNIIGIAIYAACMLAIFGPLSWAVFFRDTRQPVAADVLSANCFRMGHKSNQALKRAPKREYDPESDSL